MSTGPAPIAIGFDDEVDSQYNRRKQEESSRRQPLSPKASPTPPPPPPPFPSSQFSPSHLTSSRDAAALAQKAAARAAVVARTAHLRCLPTGMRQRDLGTILHGCGAVHRVRICGNAATDQNWVYGFVEFADKAAVDMLLNLAGMELDNGPGKPPLRLKCSRANHPIVDVLPHDADTIKGRPCTFGRDENAENCINDILLVAHRHTNSNSGHPAKDPSLDHKGAGKRSIRRTASDEQEINGGPTGEAGSVGCDCGCADDPNVRCCSCCKCHEHKQPAGRSDAAPATSSCCGGGAKTVDTEVVHPAMRESALRSLLQAASATAASSIGKREGGQLSNPATALSTIFKAMIAKRDELDANQVVESGRVLLVKGLLLAHSAVRTPGTSHGPAVEMGEVSTAFTSLLALLDERAALTGGAGSCIPGDASATVPQRATELRVEALLSLAMVCLLQRRLGDALLHFDALVEVINAVPSVPISDFSHPSDMRTGKQGVEHVGSVGDANSERGEVLGSLADISKDLRDAAHQMLPLFMEDDNEDEEEVKDAAHAYDTDKDAHPARFVFDKNYDSANGHSKQQPLNTGAPQNSLRDRDVRFHSLLVNTLLAIALSLEDVQPVVAVATCVLAAERAKRVLGMENPVLAAYVSSGSTTSHTLQSRDNGRASLWDTVPSVSAAVRAVSGAPGGVDLTSAKDITTFPRLFFLCYRQPSSGALLGGLSESVEWWQSDARPPMHLVNLFQD